MATLAEISATYDYMDPFLRGNLGRFPDLSGAYYNGDYSLSLEQAQQAKHRYILENTNFRPGNRVLDVGSGWGPMLTAVHEAGGEAVGLTLSPAQDRWCRRNGLETYLQDWKDMDADQYGKFDAIVSVGSFEHFCSMDGFLSGVQDRLYENFFRWCGNILPQSGRLYLQTMTAGDNWPSFQEISLDADKTSNEYLVALLGKFYPGSWPPSGKDQIVDTAKGFSLISSNSGRDDYIQTIKEWGIRGRKVNLAKIWHTAKLTPRYMRDKDFRYKIEGLRRHATRACFERCVLDHYRMVFQKF